MWFPGTDVDPSKHFLTHIVVVLLDFKKHCFAVCIMYLMELNTVFIETLTLYKKLFYNNHFKVQIVH